MEQYISKSNGETYGSKDRQAVTPTISQNYDGPLLEREKSVLSKFAFWDANTKNKKAVKKTTSKLERISDTASCNFCNSGCGGCAGGGGGDGGSGCSACNGCKSCE